MTNDDKPQPANPLVADVRRALLAEGVDLSDVRLSHSFRSVIVTAKLDTDDAARTLSRVHAAMRKHGEHRVTRDAPTVVRVHNPRRRKPRDV